MGAAAEWQDILKEAVKGMVILAILERLHLTRPVNWLEEHGASRAPGCCPRAPWLTQPRTRSRFLQPASAAF